MKMQKDLQKFTKEMSLVNINIVLKLFTSEENLTPTSDLNVAMYRLG